MAVRRAAATVRGTRYAYRAVRASFAIFSVTAGTAAVELAVTATPVTHHTQLLPPNRSMERRRRANPEPEPTLLIPPALLELFDPTSGPDGNGVPYHEQHDPAMNTVESLAARESLRSSPIVLDAIDRFASGFQTGADGLVRWEEYFRVQSNIAAVLLPDVPAAEAALAVRDDWERDRDGADALDYSRLYSAVFEVADLWCPSISAEEYAAFLDTLALMLEWRFQAAMDAAAMAPAPVPGAADHAPQLQQLQEQQQQRRRRAGSTAKPKPAQPPPPASLGGRGRQLLPPAPALRNNASAELKAVRRARLRRAQHIAAVTAAQGLA